MHLYPKYIIVSKDAVDQLIWDEYAHAEKLEEAEASFDELVKVGHPFTAIYFYDQLWWWDDASPVKFLDSRKDKSIPFIFNRGAVEVSA